MAGTFGATANPLAAQPTLTDIPDVDLVSPPPESISTIAFSPVADLLAVGSWGPDVSPFILLTARPCLISENLRTFVSDFSGAGRGALRFIGPDIRRRFSRPVAGESACVPSWGRVGLVLDKGENPGLVRLLLASFVASNISPNKRPVRGCVRVPVEAQCGWEVNS